MTTVDKYRDHIDSIYWRTVVDQVSAILFVNDVYSVELLVRSLNDHVDEVTANASRFAQMIFGLNDERGHFGFQALPQTVAKGYTVGRKCTAR